MNNEILNKNKDLFLKTLSDLYVEAAKKDLKNLCMNSGSEMIDESRIVFSFYNDFYVFDKSVAKIFKVDSSIDWGISVSANEGNKNNEELINKFKSPGIAGNDILDNYSSALALSYLNTSDGAGVSKDWITYGELKDGMFYAGTIPKALKPVCKSFENDFSGFLKKARTIGGHESAQFKNAVIINPFKRFPMMFMLYEKDNEFECEVKVLFSRSANHYLKTDVIKQILVHTVNKLTS